jgi:FtsP/CotA-like multicopper oxidase with cupredoxin domain
VEFAVAQPVDRARRRHLAALVAAAFAPLAGRVGAHDSAKPFGSKPLAADPPVGQRYTRPLPRLGDTGLMAQTRLSGRLTLTARVDKYPLIEGYNSDVWHYAGNVGGHAIANPLLVVKRGEEIDVTLVNRLGSDTTIHWHGLVVDEANDGSGLHPVAHDGERRYRLRVHNRAGLYWYHAHPHFRTGEQIHQGMYGPLLVEDDEELALRKRLGLAWGERDLPLVIADKQVGRLNTIKYRMGADDWIGNRMIVNWVAEPYLDAVPGLYRFRLLNVSNARMFRLAFLHKGKSLPMRLIGTDGGLLERPWRLNDAFFAPATRLDVLVDFSGLADGECVTLASLAYEPMENDAGAALEDPMLEHPGATPMGEAFDIMQFRIAGKAAKSAALPAKLSTLPAPDAKDAPLRRFRLYIGEHGRWLINDWNMHLTGHKPVFDVRRGTREVWEIANDMRSMPHPIHVHGVQFRVISRVASPPQIVERAVADGGLGAQDLGLLDTIVVWPGERVRILVDFTQPFTGKQVYMLHCHNLEHEDQGMMASFAVVDADVVDADPAQS